MCTVGSERFHQPPPRPRSTEPGEWQHGWQHHASSSLEHHFRETVVLTQSCSADQAHLRSHSGPGTGEVLLVAPTGPEFRVEPQLFRTLVLERLRLPLDVTESKCECGCFLDTTGRHRAACPRSGRLRTRAVGPERTLARVCREAGATVRINTKLRDMNVAISASDTREIEVRQRLANASRSAIGSRHHHEKCPHSQRVSVPQRSSHRRCGVAQSQIGQGKEVSRALGRRTMPPGGCGCGSRRPMEHGVCGFCDSSRGVQVPRSTSTVEGFGLLCLAAKMDEDVVHFMCKVVCELAGLDPIPHARRAGWVGA